MFVVLQAKIELLKQGAVVYIDELIVGSKWPLNQL
jgi:hypothetical protein